MTRYSNLLKVKSQNKIMDFESISAIFNVKFLIELSLDGNPVADIHIPTYRHILIDKR